MTPKLPWYYSRLVNDGMNLSIFLSDKTERYYNCFKIIETH